MESYSNYGFDFNKRVLGRHTAGAFYPNYGSRQGRNLYFDTRYTDRGVEDQMKKSLRTQADSQQHFSFSKLREGSSHVSQDSEQIKTSRTRFEDNQKALHIPGTN